MDWRRYEDLVPWRNIVTFILITLFIISYSVNMNSTAVELPVLVQYLPEGWTLPATSNFISNTASSLIFVVIFVRHFTKSISYEIPMIFIILVVGMLGLIGLVFTWQRTVIINGSLHSFYFLLCSFLLAITDSVSSVTFLPFLNRYPPKYLRAFFMGESLSTLIPLMLGLAQGAGETTCIPVITANGTIPVEHYLAPRFSPQIYFLIIAVVLVISFLSFTVLCVTRIGQLDDYQSLQTNNMQMENRNFNSECENTTTRNTAEAMSNREFWFSRHGSYFLILFMNTFILYGSAPSLLTYSLLPYSLEVYQKTLIATQLAYPMMQLVSAVLHNVTIGSFPNLVYKLFLVSMLFFSYIGFCAKMSPCPPLLLTRADLGKLIISVVWISFGCTAFLTNIIVNLYFRQVSGHRGLFWSGVIQQFGTLFGSFLFYIFTVKLKLFHERLLCKSYNC